MNQLVKFLSLTTTALLLFGCATSSPIQRYSESESNFKNPPELISHDYSMKDVYRIYHRAATGFVSIQSIRQSAEQRAESFARRQTKAIVILGEKISRPPYILGNFPRIEIVFALVGREEKNDGKEYQNKYQDLEKLKEILDKGIINQDDFEKEKEKILNQ